MSPSNQQKEGFVIGRRELFFVKKREISRLTGLSGETLKKYRLSGILSEDVHWIRVNSKLILYNAPLVLDWLQNVNHPHLHQKAIDSYQMALAPSKKKAHNSSKK
jgi:hypothetical protein